MMIRYVALDRSDFFTEDRAKVHFDRVEAREQAMMREGYIPNTLFRHQNGAVVVEASLDEISSSSISYMFEKEHEDREATNLISGRKLLPSHNGAEHGSGLTAGLDLID